MLRPRSSKVSVQNIPHVLADRAIVAKNFDALKAVSSTLSVLKWSGATFRPTTWKPSLLSFYLRPFHWKPRQSGVSLELSGLENIPKTPRNQAEVGQIYHARKAVSATLSLLKWSGAMLRPRSSKVSVQKVILSPFHCKPKPSGVSLESPELENIPQVPRNRDEVGQNHDACKAVSATLSVLKWSRAIFRSRSSKGSVQKVFLSQFNWKPRLSWVSLESPGLKSIP